MGLDTEVQLWLASAMIALGLLIFLLGLWILFWPSSFLKIGQLLGKWVSTEEYFNAIDRPRYQEGLIYRHHRISGTLIVVGAAYTLIILVVRFDTSALSTMFPSVINRDLSEWFYGTLYSLLVGANVLAIIVGMVVLIRPSLLKGIEKTLNMWILPEHRLKKLDEPHEISIDIFPGGHPRLFGLAVALGGLYMILSMGVLLL